MDLKLKSSKKTQIDSFFPLFVVFFIFDFMLIGGFSLLFPLGISFLAFCSMIGLLSFFSSIIVYKDLLKGFDPLTSFAFNFVLFFSVIKIFLYFNG